MSDELRKAGASMAPAVPGRWLRWSLVVLSLLGVFTVLLPWMRTEIRTKGEGPSHISYENGVPNGSIPGGVVGWHALVASGILLVFGLVALVFAEARPRAVVVGGLAAGILLMLIAVSFFMQGDPLREFRVGEMRGPDGPVEIAFAPSVGPYVVFALGFVLAAANALLLRLTRDAGLPPEKI